jgi:hypothetical protein
MASLKRQTANGKLYEETRQSFGAGGLARCSPRRLCGSLFSGRDGSVTRTVDGVNLAIYRGETLGLVGESGWMWWPGARGH